jgi:hypothetical protein
VVFVVDGARTMTEFYPQIAEAMTRLPDGLEFSLLFARDGVEEFSGPWRQANAAFCRGVAQRLRQAQGVGGQDNMPALLRAWDLAADQVSSAIVWIHGPQPLLLEDAEALRQRFQWRTSATGSNAPTLHVLQTQPGPNRILEKLNGIDAIRLVPRSDSLAADLRHLLARVCGDAKTFEIARERIQPDPLFLASRGKEASKHVARLWAFGEIQRLCAAREVEPAVRLAGLHQLVTPVSGAVVLESREQFQQAGLKPVEAQTVPTVPEPSSMLLMGFGFAAVWIALRKRVRTNAGRVSRALIRQPPGSCPVDFR